MDGGAIKALLPTAGDFASLPPVEQRTRLIEVLDRLLSVYRVSGGQPDAWERYHLRLAIHHLDVAAFPKVLAEVVAGLLPTAQRPVLGPAEARAAAEVTLGELLHDFHVISSFPRRVTETVQPSRHDIGAGKPRLPEATA